MSIIDRSTLDKIPDFRKRIIWFEDYRRKGSGFWPNEERSDGEELLISLVQKERLVYLLNRVLNEEEFLSEGGVRALSKFHAANPYSVTVEGEKYDIQYDPGDSTSNLFGGNSNWRGPVWIPINYLIIRSIKRYGEFYGDTLKVECPVGSGNQLNLIEVAEELTKRVISLFAKDDKEGRKINGDYNWFYQKKGNEGLVNFFEYFHGDNGRGLGASHQTGWTSLVADLIGGGKINKEEWGPDGSPVQ